MVTDDSCGELAENDTVSAVAKRNVGVRVIGTDADVREAVLGFGKRACPRVGGFTLHFRKESAEHAEQGGGFCGEQRVASLRITERFIEAADHGAAIRRAACVEIGASRFPQETIVKASPRKFLPVTWR